MHIYESLIILEYIRGVTIQKNTNAIDELDGLPSKMCY
jgi:hypothetical protein